LLTPAFRIHEVTPDAKGAFTGLITLDLPGNAGTTTMTDAADQTQTGGAERAYGTHEKQFHPLRYFFCSAGGTAKN
jgi:hypothetical protein